MMEIMRASAGSGKTYSLTKKYIELLLSGNDPYAYRHILAVTFTNKATDEMKSRILKELYVLSGNPEASPYFQDFVPSLFSSPELLQKRAKDMLSGILHDYGAFAVSTIDRFFQQTLKAFAREIGQFASYRVELDRDAVVAESVDRILDSLSADSPVLLKWLTDNVLEQIEKGDRYNPDANLLKMAQRLFSVQRMEKAGHREFDDAKAYSKENLAILRKRCRSVKEEFEGKVCEKAKSVTAAIRDADVTPEDFYRSFIKVVYSYESFGKDGFTDAPSDSFVTRASDSSLWFPKAKASRLLPLVEPLLASPIEDFLSLFGRPYSLYRTSVIIDSQIYGLGVASELAESFKALMKEKNIICLDDSNAILKNIIDGSDTPFIYEKLGVKYEHFLLDEFQDTSRIQWENFLPLIHNSDDQNFDNLIVGDVKQSIYRWRGSEWQMLQSEVAREFPACRDHSLESNFRSQPAVVEFNNSFFSNAMAYLDSLGNGDSQYSLRDIYRDVVQKAARREGQGSVDVTFCESSLELDKVLETVNSLVEAGAAYSDIAVLVRNNASGQEVANHLIENGLEVATEDSLAVKSSLTVRRLVSLMSFSDNPDDRVNGWLASSLGIEKPSSCNSLTEMAEAILRSLETADPDTYDGETVYIQSFMDYLNEYSTEEGNNLRSFLKVWEEANPSISAAPSGNKVRVMTIHKSKGLDFPYVIVPFVEKITMFKASDNWCFTSLGPDVPEEFDCLFDVNLSEKCLSTLFADDYRRENEMQRIDNVNVLYVALTRAAKGMHLISSLPSKSFLKDLETGTAGRNTIRDCSHLLYWYSHCCHDSVLSLKDRGEWGETYGSGSLWDFSIRSESREDDVIEKITGFPSIPLNGSSGIGPSKTRGRLRISSDASDFFSVEGDAGINSSTRVKGVVLHEILSKVKAPSDLDAAVAQYSGNGWLDAEEASHALALLSGRIRSAAGRGWFPEEGAAVYNEVALIDTDGAEYRPDRVIDTRDGVIIVDYKFGSHHKSYESQVARYADLYRRMGMKIISASLWYVISDEVVDVI
ncbi:MAG: UvrD-helicase domain-containing protein [Candidatus Cryptobacteroides sp.]